MLPPPPPHDDCRTYRHTFIDAVFHSRSAERRRQTCLNSSVTPSPGGRPATRLLLRLYCSDVNGGRPRPGRACPGWGGWGGSAMPGMTVLLSPISQVTGNAAGASYSDTTGRAGNSSKKIMVRFPIGGGGGGHNNGARRG